MNELMSNELLNRLAAEAGGRRHAGRACFVQLLAFARSSALPLYTYRIVSINIGVIVYFRLHQMKDSCIYILFAKVINVNIFIFHNPSSIVTHT